MRVWPLLPLLLSSSALAAQTVCPPTPAYSPCELVFEMSPGDVQAHPNPYASVNLEVQFRSPRFRSYLLPAYYDGGNRLVVRFAPTEAGAWDFRVTSNLTAFDGKIGRVEATASSSPGFVRPRNVHHWGYTETDQPHLWMGDTSLRFAVVDQGVFDRLLEVRSRQKFNHIRGYVLGAPEDAAAAFPAPDQPNINHFRRLDQRVMAMNKTGIVADLVLAGSTSQLVKIYPAQQDRERYLRYVAARYAALHVTWQMVEEFESYAGGRELLKEIGTLLRKLDPYNHPRSSGAQATSSPLAADGWMNYVVHSSADNALGSIEHQLYAVPFVNVNFGAEDGDTDTFRKRLWNSSMNGQYPTFAPANSGSLDSTGARQMTVWLDFFSGTRHWELEPYFDVDGGRALALEVPREEDEPPEGIEYIVYVEKPGPVEIVLQRHSYDVAWLNPITGERIKQKDFRGDRLKIQPPDSSHDWVLHVSREGKKQGMLRSYKFETHSVQLQEVEQNAQRVPFEIAEPAASTVTVGKPVRFAVKVSRDTRATRSMLWLWTAEVSADGEGYRAVGSGQEGQMTVPESIASRYPAVMNLRLAGMNANGKVYFLDKIYRLER